MAHTSTFTKNRHEENMNASSRYCPPNSRPSTRAGSDPPANPTGSLRAVIHVVHRFFPLTLSQYLFPGRPIRADVSWGNCNATLSLLTRWVHIIDL